MHVSTIYIYIRIYIYIYIYSQPIGTNCNNYNVIVCLACSTLFNVSIMAVRISSDLTLHVVIMLCVSELCCTSLCGLFDCVS